MQKLELEYAFENLTLEAEKQVSKILPQLPRAVIDLLKVKEALANNEEYTVVKYLEVENWRVTITVIVNIETAPGLFEFLEREDLNSIPPRMLSCVIPLDPSMSEARKIHTDADHTDESLWSAVIRGHFTISLP